MNSDVTIETKFECSECNKKYNTKEFSQNNLDFCCLLCMKSYREKNFKIENKTTQHYYNTDDQSQYQD